MVEYDAFRHDLATALLDCADRRRATFAGGQATGEDIKIVALLERLAEDVKNLDLHVFLIFELMFTHRRLARRFLRQNEYLLSQIGILYCPASATDLLRWLIRHAIKDDQRDQSPVHKRSPIPALPYRGGTSRSRCDDAAKPASHHGLLVSIASDISAGFGIVAPILAVGEVGLGIGQWRERAIADEHAAVPATIISAEPSAGVRTSGLSTKMVLSFRPAESSDMCRVPVWISHSPEQPVPGTTMMVVPRSADCEAPLIPSEIGDPLSMFELAAALMAGGLAALYFWNRLARPGRYSAPRPDPQAWRRPHATIVNL